MKSYQRSSQPHGAWVLTWAGSGLIEGAGRMVGVDDDGPIRFIDLAAGSTHTGRHATMDHMAAQNPGYIIPMNPPCVYEITFRDRVTDMMRLVDELSRSVSYSGSGLLGVYLDSLDGRVAQAPQAQLGYSAPGRYSAGTYTFTSRATARQIADDPEGISATLLRRLYRGLGTEGLLS